MFLTENKIVKALFLCFLCISETLAQADARSQKVLSAMGSPGAIVIIIVVVLGCGAGAYYCYAKKSKVEGSGAGS